MKLLRELKEHLKDMKVDWQLCGGFAIDAFLGEVTREHKDIDITVSFNDAEECIRYLRNKGWEIDAPVGGGRLLPVEEAMKRDDLLFDNIWCYRKGADFIKTEREDGEFKYKSFIEREQKELDFLEVMFNKVEDEKLYYQKNESITLHTNRAFVEKGGMTLLAPEMILLYKSRSQENMKYKQDFDLAIKQLDEEGYQWLTKAMEIEYPQGHPWINNDKDA